MEKEIRIPSYKNFLKRKILVIHMETIDFNIEGRLEFLEIPFISLSYSDKSYPDKIKDSDFFGIIVSGSINSDPELLPGVSDLVLKSKVPKLGICYGAELFAKSLGASLKKQKKSDQEHSVVLGKLYPSPLFKGIDITQEVMFNMNHDYSFSCPEGSKIIASTEKDPVAGFEDEKNKIFALQFHPEKGILGDIIFKNFFNICSEHQKIK